MKCMVTGNMGYVGSVLTPYLRSKIPDIELCGLDVGFFSQYLTGAKVAPEAVLNTQYFYDVREAPENIFNGVDCVVHLAAISNDPIGSAFEKATFDVNSEATIRTAEKAKAAGAKSFVFASSCSVYGFSDSGECNEASTTNPLTAYAKSKLKAEEGLKRLADDRFKVTCLRFATACGMSPRLRLDLVLNDFVATAKTSKEIAILSDGTPWRPLINVRDMARAIEWAISRSEGDNALVVNVGSNVWNYQIKDLAMATSRLTGNSKVTINKNATPDKRSYRVNFDLFNSLFSNFSAGMCSLDETVSELCRGVESMKIDSSYKKGPFIRLNVLSELRELGYVDSDLRRKND